MYVGRLELHLILQKSAWDRPRVPNFRSRRVIFLCYGYYMFFISVSFVYLEIG